MQRRPVGRAEPSTPRTPAGASIQTLMTPPVNSNAVLITDGAEPSPDVATPRRRGRPSKKQKVMHLFPETFAQSPSGLFSLGEELLTMLFQFMTPRSVVALGKTCRTLRRICMTEVLWKKLCDRDFHIITKGPIESYAEVYQIMYGCARLAGRDNSRTVERLARAASGFAAYLYAFSEKAPSDILCDELNIRAPNHISVTKARRIWQLTDEAIATHFASIPSSRSSSSTSMSPVHLYDRVLAFRAALANHDGDLEALQASVLRRCSVLRGQIVRCIASNRDASRGCLVTDVLNHSQASAMATVFPDAVCSRFRKSADDDGTNDAEDVGRRRRPAYDPRHEDSAKHPLIETFMQTGLDADKVTATRWALAFKCVAKLLHGKALQRSLRVDDHVFRRVVDAAVDHVAATAMSRNLFDNIVHLPMATENSMLEVAVVFFSRVSRLIDWANQYRSIQAPSYNIFNVYLSHPLAVAYFTSGNEDCFKRVVLGVTRFLIVREWATKAGVTLNKPAANPESCIWDAMLDEALRKFPATTPAAPAPAASATTGNTAAGRAQAAQTAVNPQLAALAATARQASAASTATAVNRATPAAATAATTTPATATPAAATPAARRTSLFPRNPYSPHAYPFLYRHHDVGSAGAALQYAHLSQCEAYRTYEESGEASDLGMVQVWLYQRCADELSERAAAMQGLAKTTRRRWNVVQKRELPEADDGAAESSDTPRKKRVSNDRAKRLLLSGLDKRVRDHKAQIDTSLRRMESEAAALARFKNLHSSLLQSQSSFGHFPSMNRDFFENMAQRSFNDDLIHRISMFERGGSPDDFMSDSEMDDDLF